MANEFERRQESDGWVSFTDFLELSDLAKRLIVEAGHGPHELYRAETEGARIETGQRSEFERDLAGYTLGQMADLTLHHGPGRELTVMVTCGSLAGRKTYLAVKGGNRTDVEGIFVQMAEAVARRRKPYRELASERVTAHAAAPTVATYTKAVTLGQHWWQNPWIVTVAGGLIVAVVVAVLFGT